MASATTHQDHKEISSSRVSNTVNYDYKEDDEEEEEVPLPGFRFHPTDEELVGFYLRRKVDKKPIALELIKQVDIYKYDPWDLPKSSSMGDNEGYFFCKRGRKYRNSIRPNRVTKSGFWKATGIDKPVYSHGGQGGDAIGLKKTLVYYQGSAGKGTKTEWMMHEFRLPTSNSDTTVTTNLANVGNNSTQEAEVWTLCRIFKRNVSNRKYTPDWRQISTKREGINTSSKTCSVDSTSTRENYVCFSDPLFMQNLGMKQIESHVMNEGEQLNASQLSSIADHHHHDEQPPSMASAASSISSPYGSELVAYGDWDELRSVVDFAFAPSLI